MAHEMMVLALQFGIILIAAKFLGRFFSQKLKQPKVLGELLAGMIVGPQLLGGITLPVLGVPLFPHVSGSIPVSAPIYAIATLGSIFLLFNSGLETDVPTFLKFSGKASVVGIGGVVVSFLLGAYFTVLFVPRVTSIADPTAMFLGTILTATSIGITARILSESKKMSSPEGVTILAAAVLDDVISIVLLSVVVGITEVKILGGELALGTIGFIALKAILFWIICTAVGIFLAPYFTKGMKKFKSKSLIAEVSFGIALLFAGLSEMAGLAMIIGAYIAGLSLSQTDVAYEIQERVANVSKYFVPIFFAVMGMMVDFKAMGPVLLFGLAFAVLGIVAKLIGCGIPALFVGFNLKGAYRIGCGMLPRGEVTLIVAGIGLSSGAIGPDMFGVAVTTMLLASIVAPTMLTSAFKGKSGYKKEMKSGQISDYKTIDLTFPDYRSATFIRHNIFDNYKEAGFFITPLEGVGEKYQIRKDRQAIILTVEDDNLILGFSGKDESFVKLMLAETLADVKSFVDTLALMDDGEAMGARLMASMFASGEDDE